MTETRTRRTVLALLVTTFLIAAGIGGVATVATLGDTETVSITASADVRPTGTETPAETSTPTPTPAETSTPTPTPTPAETSTPTPTPTPAETSTPTPTPTPTPTERQNQGTE